MTSNIFVVLAGIAVASSVGCSKPTASASEEQKPAAAVKATPGSPVTITVNEDGFAPNHVEVPRGDKATLQFRRTSDQTCAKEVAFPELGITKELPLNQVVSIDVPADKPRTLTFQCGMGMYKSKVVVL